MTDASTARRRQRVVVIGHTDVGRRVCTALGARGVDTIHLDEPSEAELRTLLHSEADATGIDGVTIMLHDDLRALRYALGVEHIQPGIRMFVAMFDSTARLQLERSVPNCVVLSPAAIAVPSMVAAAIAPDAAAIKRQTDTLRPRWVRIAHPSSCGDDGVTRHVGMAPFLTPAPLRLHGLLGRLLGQLRPYDAGTTVLLSGLFGLLSILVVDTLLGLHHTEGIRAFYDAARTTATISTPELPDDEPTLLWASVAALLVIGFTATFGAGIVHHLLSGRHASLLGRRVIPRRGHVIVAGMGQVGLRLAQELRALGVAVIGVERVAGARGVDLARGLGIPILIGDASSRRVLRRASLSRAVAIVAVGSHERDNIAVAVAAQAVDSSARIIVRAGADDAVEETRSLFHIGSITDVNSLTASFVVEAITADAPYAVIATERGICAVDDAGTVTRCLAEAGRCGCVYDWTEGSGR